MKVFNVFRIFFILLGTITLVLGTELYVANKHFMTYEQTYEAMSSADRQEFTKFYIFRLNNHFHGYFAKALGFPKNPELQKKIVE